MFKTDEKTNAKMNATAGKINKPVAKMSKTVA